MSQINENQIEALLRIGFSELLFEKLSFFSKGKSNLLSQLHSVIPSNTTSFFDAMLLGIQRILDLHSLLSKLETSSIWNFVHIIVTDGEDTSSKSALDELLSLMMLIGIAVPKEILKTWIVGVDIQKNKKALADIAAITVLGGENCDFMNISNLEISKVFEKIKIQLGLGKKLALIEGENMIAITQQNFLSIGVKKERYVVLFTLDKSFSMKGQKWKKLCQGVEIFMKGLDDNDLVGCTLFNNNVIILSNEIQNENDYSILYDNKMKNSEELFNTSLVISNGNNSSKNDEDSSAEIYGNNDDSNAHQKEKNAFLKRSYIKNNYDDRKTYIEHKNDDRKIRENKFPDTTDSSSLVHLEKSQCCGEKCSLI